MRTTRPDRLRELPGEYVVFDTETTGSPPGCRMVEIGALRVRGRSVVDRFERLIHPEGPIPPEVIQVHGITDDDVADAPTARDVVPEWLSWLGSDPVFAHNASFDAAVIGAECARLGIAPGDNAVYCTLAASRKHLKRRSHSLENLVKDLGLPPGQHHRATQDAEHALHLLWRLQDVAGSELTRRSLGPGRGLGEYLPDRPRIPDSRRVLTDAADLQEAVEVHYSFHGQRVVPLRVTPRFFFARGRTVLMEALCHQDLHYKSYRLDRIAAAHPCPEAPPVQVRRARS